MKVLFSRKTVIITVIALAIAAIAVVSLNTSGSSGTVTSLGNAVSKPLKQVVSSVARTFESIYGNIYKYDNIVAENVELKAQLAALRQDYLEYTELAAEVERLRELIGFSARYADRVLEPAVIIQPGSSNWTSTYTINKGSSNSGVAVGNSVMTESGVLLGRITSVSSTTSVFTSIIDTTFSAAVLIGDGGSAAVAQGDFALMRSGMLKLDRIPDDAAVVPGDVVITSGKGGVYPSGLTIGEVVELYYNSTGIGRHATIQPMLDLDEITYVYVITEFEIME